jgi:hypothetical protein
MALAPNYPEFGKASATKHRAFQRGIGNRGNGGCQVRGGNHPSLLFTCTSTDLRELAYSSTDFDSELPVIFSENEIYQAPKTSNSQVCRHR